MMPDASPTPIDADMVVAEVMRLWPQTVPVFIERRMACPGCPMAPFLTLGEAAASYAVEPDDLVDALRRAAGRSPRRSRR
jgi:hybrid cluster-associated redox disulfide protein